MIRLFRVLVPNSVLALLVSEFAVICTCYVIAGYAAMDFSSDVFLLSDRGLWRIAFLSLFIVAGLHFHDLYESYRIPSRIALIQQFCFVVGLAFFMQAILSYGRFDIILPKWQMLYGSVLVLLLAPAWRMIFSRAVVNSVGSEKILFAGASEGLQEIAHRIAEQPQLGLTVVGYIPASDRDPELQGIPKLGGPDDFKSVLEMRRPDRIVVAREKKESPIPLDQLLNLRFSGMPIEEETSAYERVFHRVPTRNLQASRLIFSHELGEFPSILSLQSSYSWLIAVIALALLSPLMLIVALLVKLTSPGPVLFRQTRVGKGGQQFTLYKFRSMREDAEAKTGAVWATKNDPRVTPLGRWLRKLRLDELPQLFNVVRGEMVIVGPRPERPEFVERLQHEIPFYRHRLAVKPGITGWAQISHKYGDTMEDTVIKLEYDLYYIKHASLALDLFVMFHTLKTVLTGRGAQ